MLLRFPKMVEVRNPRLVLLYGLMQFTTCVVLLWWFVTQRFWDKSMDISGYINAGISATEHRITGRSFRASIEELRAGVCATAADVNHCEDEECRIRYQNYSCSYPCLPPVGGFRNPNASQPVDNGPCSMSEDTYLSKNDNEIFVPTTRTRRVRVKGSPPQQENQFLLTPDALAITFVYFVDIPRFRPDGVIMVERARGSSQKTLWTDVLDSNGNVNKTVPAGEDMTFTVQQLLYLAGVPDVLDEPHWSASNNQRPGSVPEPPITRVTGMELLANIRCGADIGYFSGVINGCRLSFRMTERGWSSERILDLVGQGGIFVQYTGIRIRTVGEGTATFFHFGTLISRLTTCVVIIMLPRKLVMFLCTVMLGHLSTIYSQAVYEKFQIRDALAGMSARLMVWNTAFVDLVDQEGGGSASVNGMNSMGISKKRVRERLGAVLKNRGSELDEGEINHLVEFCYSALFRLSDLKMNGNLSQLRHQAKSVVQELRSTSTEQSTEDSRVIDQDVFSVACTSDENLNFDAVVKLFDVQRKRHLLERIFTPKELTLDLKATHEAAVHEEIDHVSVESDMDAPPAFYNSEGEQTLPRPSIHSVQHKQSMPILAKDPDAPFTLEEERELRKNLHKKVAQLLEDKQKILALCDETRRTVQEHRQFFDTRHREHAAKLLQESEDTRRRVQQVDNAVAQRQGAIEGAADALRGEVTDRLNSLEKMLHDHLSSLPAEGLQLQLPNASAIDAPGASLTMHTRGAVDPEQKVMLHPAYGQPLAKPVAIIAPSVDGSPPPGPVSSQPSTPAATPAAPQGQRGSGANPLSAGSAAPAPAAAAQSPPASSPRQPPPQNNPSDGSTEASSKEDESKEPWRPIFLATLTSKR